MEEYIKLAFKKSQFLYYLVFAKAILIAFIGYWLNNNFNINLNQEYATVISSFTTLYLVVSIPLILWYFNKQVVKMASITDVDIRYATYMKWIKIRIFVVGANFIVNIALYYLMHTSSFLYAAAIGAVAMLFCKPNKLTVEKELNPITEIE